MMTLILRPTSTSSNWHQPPKRNLNKKQKQKKQIKEEYRSDLRGATLFLSVCPSSCPSSYLPFSRNSFVTWLCFLTVWNGTENSIVFFSYVAPRSGGGPRQMSFYRDLDAPKDDDFWDKDKQNKQTKNHTTSTLVPPLPPSAPSLQVTALIPPLPFSFCFCALVHRHRRPASLRSSSSPQSFLIFYIKNEPPVDAALFLFVSSVWRPFPHQVLPFFLKNESWHLLSNPPPVISYLMCWSAENSRLNTGKYWSAVRHQSTLSCLVFCYVPCARFASYLLNEC